MGSSEWASHHTVRWRFALHMQSPSTTSSRVFPTFGVSRAQAHSDHSQHTGYCQHLRGGDLFSSSTFRWIFLSFFPPLLLLLSVLWLFFTPSTPLWLDAGQGWQRVVERRKEAFASVEREQVEKSFRRKLDEKPAIARDWTDVHVIGRRAMPSFAFSLQKKPSLVISHPPPIRCTHRHTAHTWIYEQKLLIWLPPLWCLLLLAYCLQQRDVCVAARSGDTIYPITLLSFML